MVVIINEDLRSSELIHPGEMIKDEIMARGLTQKELAQQMGVSYAVFNEILNGKRPVTTEYALMLEAALGTNANIWLGLQADYNMQMIKQDKSFMKKLEKIRKNAADFCLYFYTLNIESLQLLHAEKNCILYQNIYSQLIVITKFLTKKVNTISDFRTVSSTLHVQQFRYFCWVEGPFVGVNFIGILCVLN